MSPLLFEVEGTPCVLSPVFFPIEFFCTNANGIHWMIGAIFVKFSQLILMKIIKIVANGCQILRLKCTKFNFGWGSAPEHAVGAYSAPPDPLIGFKGLLLRGVEGGDGSPLLFSVDFRPWLPTGTHWLCRPPDKSNLGINRHFQASMILGP